MSVPIVTFLCSSLTSAVLSRGKRERRREFFLAERDMVERRRCAHSTGVPCTYGTCIHRDRRDWENLLAYIHASSSSGHNERFRKAAGRKISGRLAARHEKWNWTLLAIAATNALRLQFWLNTHQDHGNHRFCPGFIGEFCESTATSTCSFFRRPNFYSHLFQLSWMESVRTKTRDDDRCDRRKK